MSAVPNKPRQSSTPTVCASFSGGPLYTCPLNSRKTFPGRQILFPINLYCKSHDMSSSLQNLHFDQSQWKCLRHFNRSFPTHERAPWPPSVPFFRMQICSDLLPTKVAVQYKVLPGPSKSPAVQYKVLLVPASLLQFLLNGQ